MEQIKYNKLAAYIDISRHSFDSDPADTEYQEGYLEALNDLQDFIDSMEEARA